MKIWNETREVIQECTRLLATGTGCAIVVLTHVKGSAYRRPGAKLLVRADGSIYGSVSGGCLENDLRERARAAISNGIPQKVHYETGSDEDTIWGLGLGCDGILDLMIYPQDGALHLAWIHQTRLRMEAGNPFALHWPLNETPGAAPSIHDGGEAGNPEMVFVDPLQPPPDLFVIGAGDDAIPLVKMAGAAGMRVTVIDHRMAYLESRRFPDAHALLNLRPDAASTPITFSADAFVLIKNHALEMDKKWARVVGASPAKYIGILGPKKRCAEIHAQMARGTSGRIFGPAGLDLGSEGAEQIAISIVAEMLCIWSGRNGSHLRDRSGSIHGK